MTREHFQVREFEGFPINLPVRNTTATTGHKPSLQVLVLDTAYSWRTVASWDTQRIGGTRVSRYALARAAAAERAAALNAEHGQAA